jgi:hypothetical protein
MISLGLAVGTTGAAVKFGDFSARRIGAAFLSDWLASLLVVDVQDAYNVGLAMLAADGVTLVYFVWISLQSRRLWTAVASAFLAIIVASHVATMIDLRVTISTFRLSMAIWSYGILACLAFGTWAAWRDRRKAGSPSIAGGADLAA